MKFVDDHGLCLCTCTPCTDGYHLFCNIYMHGDPSDAVQWFVDHPEALDTVTPRDQFGRESIEEARMILAAR